MNRTSKRPVANNRISSTGALYFGIILTVSGFTVLVTITNLLAAMLALSGNLFYILIYTLWLKKRTVHNIVIGGIAGCFPPLVGWAAVTGSIALPAWYLFAIIFFWTPPHFWALAMLMKDDYSKANIPMLPSVIGIKATFRPMLLHTITLVMLTITMIFISQKLGILYLTSCVVMGVSYVLLTIKAYTSYNKKINLNLYKFSLLYIMVLCLSIIIDSII